MMCMLCDRYSMNIPKSQIGFIDYVAKPFFLLWSAQTGTSKYMLGIELAAKYWIDRITANVADIGMHVVCIIMHDD